MKCLRALALSFFVCSGAFAQNAVLMPPPKLQFFDSKGSPLAGGFVYTCVAGSTCPGTPQPSYTDATGVVQNANPVVLDAGGYASIWLTWGSSYKIVVQNSGGVTVSTTDNYTASSLPAGAQLAQLRIKPNTMSGTTYQFVPPSTVLSTDYNFGAQSPGGSLTAAVSNTVTMTPCPLGVSGADTSHYLYITGARARPKRC